MSTLSLLFYFAFVVIVAAFLYLRFANLQTDDLPGPPSRTASFIWGHELTTFRHEATEIYSRWTSAYGAFFKIKGALFHPNIIVTSDHAAVQHIFADSINYVKSPAFRPPVANLIGKGIVWAEGDDHALQRRVLLPAFKPEAIRSMADATFDSAERCETRISNLIQSCGGGATINIVEYVSRCTLDIIGRVGFGHEFTDQEAKEIADSWHKHVNMGLSFAGFLAPLILRTFPSITSLPLKSLKAQGETKVLVGKLAKRLLEKGSDGKDILSHIRSKELTEEQILDNVSTMVMVGHETTAGSLAFTFHALAQNPRVQDKLRAELNSLGREPTYDDVEKNLPFLEAVVKEGLRLYPASPQTERVALKDDVVPLSTPIRTSDGTLHHSWPIKKGQVFHIPFTTIQTRIQVWGLDAHTFNPDRWLLPPSKGGVPAPKDLPHGWSGLVAFCDGPRTCLGYRLAILEMKVILASVLRKVVVKETAKSVKQKISPTLQPVTGGVGGLLEVGVMAVA